MEIITILLLILVRYFFHLRIYNSIFTFSTKINIAQLKILFWDQDYLKIFQYSSPEKKASDFNGQRNGWYNWASSSLISVWFAWKSQIYHLIYVLLLQIMFQLASAMDAGQISNGSKELGSMKQSADLKCRSGWRREWKVDQNIWKMWNWKRRLGSGHSVIFVVVEKLYFSSCHHLNCGGNPNFSISSFPS